MESASVCWLFVHLVSMQKPEIQELRLRWGNSGSLQRDRQMEGQPRENTDGVRRLQATLSL